MPQRTVYLARHGDREDFADPEWSRHADRPYDPDLSTEGTVHARRLAGRVGAEPIDCLYSSPYLRAVHTAHYCARALNLPIRIEEGFGERLAAQWFDHRPRTRSCRELRERFDTVDPRYRSVVHPAFPEEPAQTARRFSRTIELVLRQTRGAVLIVGHGATYHGVTAALVHGAFDPAADPASLSRIDLEGGIWTLTYHNDTSFVNH